MVSVSKRKIIANGKSLEVVVPDTRGVTLSPWMQGNLKLGADVYSFSRLPGRPDVHGGTCPGSTPECLSFCYSFRIMGLPRMVMEENSKTDYVPPIPDDAKLVRLHVSGDFDTAGYIANWIERMRARPEVKFWVYTRAWRVPALLPMLEHMRSLDNVQMFASMDASDDLLPPAGWRRSWLSNDERSGMYLMAGSSGSILDGVKATTAFDGTPSLICPEETGRREDCQSCGYCFLGQRGDVGFIIH